VSNDRLSELKRQKQLLQEHLQWLEKEIDEASGKSSSIPSGAAKDAASAVATPPPEATGPQAAAASPTSSPEPSPITDETGAPQKEQDPEVEQILSSFSANPKNQIKSAQTGCLVFTIALFLILCGIVFAVYWFGYRKTDDTVDTDSPKAALCESTTPDMIQT